MMTLYIKQRNQRCAPPAEASFSRLPRMAQSAYIAKAQTLGIDYISLFSAEQEHLLDNAASLPVCCEQNLDNCTEDTHYAETMPLTEGADEMHKRQKLTINNVERWVSFNTTQELVNIIQREMSKRSHPATTLTSEYMLDWFETYKRPKLDPNTAGGELSLIRKHILPLIGDKPINEVCTADVQKAVSALNSASMGKKVKSVISQCFNAAIADELYTHHNPADDKRITLPTKASKREPVEKNDLAIIMSALPNLPTEHARMLAVLLMTGCRRGEALAVHWEDIDWDKKSIHLQRTVRFRNNQPEISTKMKTQSANRNVSLWESLIPYLGEPQKTGLIINHDGKPLTERQYRLRWDAIQKALKEAGVEKSFTAHQLRHTYATVAANSGDVPLKVLQGLLEHENFQTTMNTYASTDTDQMLIGSGKISEKYAEIAERVAAKVADEKP